MKESSHVAPDAGPLVDGRGRLLRRALVARLARSRASALVVAGLGNPTYDLASTGDRPENFYLWGAMGLAVPVGLGLALARPERRVAVLTGDGEMMMGIGSLATVANLAPANLAILVLDNRSFAETGGQAGLTAGPTDIAGMARGAGFAQARTWSDAAEVDALAEMLWRTPGPVLAVAPVAVSDDPRVMPSLDGALLARRLMGALGLGAPG